MIVHTYHGHVLRGYFDPVRTRAFLETERALARQTTRLIAVAPGVRDDSSSSGWRRRRSFGHSPRHRPGSADPRRPASEYRRLFGVPEDRFVVGWIGRMTAIKRLPDLLRSFAQLLDRGIEATLCLVGDGPDREAVEELASELGVTRHVLFVGYQREVAPYYAFFDALALPSANEGTPVVAIESLAAARPVVATRVGGVEDVVSDGIDGFLVEPGSVEGVTDALARLAVDPVLRAQMGAAGRERVIPRYRVSRLVDDVDELYRELLSERKLPLPSA